MSKHVKPLAFAVAGVLVAGLAACSSASPDATSTTGTCAPSTQPTGAASSQPVTLEYWAWDQGTIKAVDKFNATHPDIHIDLKTVDAGSQYQNLSNALKAGTAPDLAQVEYFALPTFKLQNGLENIASCEPVATLKNDVIPWTYSQVSLGGDELYGAPVDTSPLALYYRKDVFEKYGISVPTTWAEYEQAGETIKEKDPGAFLTSLSAFDGGLLIGLQWANGAKPFTYNGDTFQFAMDGSESAKVSDYWQGLIDKGLVDTNAPTFTTAQYSGWADGTIVSTPGPIWYAQLMASSAAGSAGKWAVAPLPQWQEGGQSSGNYGGSSVAVMAGTKHPYEAAVFADWLSTSPDAAESLEASGELRAAPAEASDPAISAPQEYFGGQPIFQVFQDASEHVDASFQWAPNQTNVFTFLQDSLTGVFSGTGTTVGQAFQSAQQKAADDLKSRAVDVEVK